MAIHVNEYIIAFWLYFGANYYFYIASVKQSTIEQFTQFVAISVFHQSKS